MLEGKMLMVVFFDGRWNETVWAWQMANDVEGEQLPADCELWMVEFKLQMMDVELRILDAGRKIAHGGGF